MRGQIPGRVTGLLALGVGCAMLLVACGESSRAIHFDRATSFSSSSSDLELPDTLAEREVAPAPEGVDAALWQELKDELGSLVVSSGGKVASRVPTRKIEFLETPPEYHETPIEPPYRFVWSSSFFRTDGNQDGAVTIQDLTPIVAHFNASVGATPQAKVADYNRDGVVNIADVTPLAANLGVNVDRFEVALATMGDEITFDQFPPEPIVDLMYSDSTGRDECGFKTWEFEFNQRPEQASFWIVVTAVDGEGLKGQPSVVWVIVPWEVPFQVDDLVLDPEVEPPDIGVTWTTAFFKGDGNQDGWLNIGDVTPVGACFGDRPSEVPEATVADYDGNGIVNMGDIGVAGQYAFRYCYQFDVEISTAGPDDGYELDGSVEWYDSDEVNQYGFKVFRYTLVDPPETRPFWVRVTPQGRENDPGVPSAPLEIAE